MKRIAMLAGSALLLAGSATMSTAQPAPDGMPMMPPGQTDSARPGSGPGQGPDERWRDGDRAKPGPDRGPAARADRDDDDDKDKDWRGRSGMGWHHRWDRDGDRPQMRGHMMGPGMMGPGMMRMMIVLMDTDNDGALSLEEIQAVHARIFKLVDADGDGRVTLEEMQAFMRDMKGPRGPQ